MKTEPKPILFSVALISALAFSTAPAAELTPAEARAIAKEAYIYGYPMVDRSVPDWPSACTLIN